MTLSCRLSLALALALGSGAGDPPQRGTALDLEGHSVLQRLYIHDGLANGWSYVLGVKGPAVKGLALAALSPDGSQLAILNGGVIELLSLPHAH